MNKEDDEPVTLYAVQPRPSRFKRLVRYMTTPRRLITGLPVAYVLAWLGYHHQVTDNRFWFVYSCYLLGIFIAFWLYEVHHWAGGESKVE